MKEIFKKINKIYAILISSLALVTGLFTYVIVDQRILCTYFDINCEYCGIADPVFYFFPEKHPFTEKVIKNLTNISFDEKNKNRIDTLYLHNRNNFGIDNIKVAVSEPNKSCRSEYSGAVSCFHSPHFGLGVNEYGSFLCDKSLPVLLNSIDDPKTCIITASPDVELYELGTFLKKNNLCKNNL